MTFMTESGFKVAYRCIEALIGTANVRKRQGRVGVRPLRILDIFRVRNSRNGTNGGSRGACRIVAVDTARITVVRSVAESQFVVRLDVSDGFEMKMVISEDEDTVSEDRAVH